jgi:hypothetical protein
MKRLALMACALALAVGCGSTGGVEPAAAAAQPSTPAPSGEASAEQVAKEMRGDVKCPAQPSAPRPAGAPVDDVVGVRPGMSWDEATRFVMCDHPLMVIQANTGRNFDIQTYGQPVRQGFAGNFAEPRVVKTSRDYLREMSEEASRRSANARVVPLQPGQSRVYVSTMGTPGQEQVVSVSREEYFAEGKLPTVDSVKQALVAKYGQPSSVNEAVNVFQMWWEYDPSGSTNTTQACRISVGPDAGAWLSTACGITVGAQIRSSSTNTGLAHSLAVTSQNGASGYALLKRTEDSLRAADDARKAKELNEASKNAGTPRL